MTPLKFAGLSLWVSLGLAFVVHADGPDDNFPSKVRPVPPPGIEVDLAKQNELREAAQQIRRGSESIEGMSDFDRSQIEVFARAIEMTLEHQMFYSEAEVAMGAKIADLARQRIALAKQGVRGLLLMGAKEGESKPQLLVGGFRSNLDQSIQPFGLIVPAGWSRSSPPRRLDVWLHGRDERSSEVGFLNRRLSQLGEFASPDTFVVHPYGRYSNAFKFAGEIDVLESIAAVEKLVSIDSKRIAIRGFSMGGAGCWQMAVHYPDRWFAATPGAGFCETTQFLSSFQKENFQPTPFQKRLLHWYDCPDWSNNLRYLRTVAYSGELDRQKQAADVMEEAMKDRGLKLLHVIGPGTEHKFHPEAKKTIEAQLKDWEEAGRDSVPKKIDFTTYTLRYPSFAWIRLQRLGSHWEEARIRAELTGEKCSIQCKNIDHFSIDLPASVIGNQSRASLEVTIDGSVIPVTKGPQESFAASFVREGTAWRKSESTASKQGKRPGVQGPIDDAFMSRFLFVPPDKTTSTSIADRWVSDEYRHATKEWRRHFRGDIHSRPANEISDKDIAESNLILFGTPATNSFLAKIVDRLPVRWDTETVQVGNHKLDADRHVAIMIFPNPLNPDRYVVLNSGFTFREFAYLNNARQIPMMPDWGLVDVSGGSTYQFPGKVVAAGFFDEDWKISGH